MRIFDGKWHDEFYEGEVIPWRGFNRYGRFRPSVEILKIISMPCPRGRGFPVEMFQRYSDKAFVVFLCRVRNLPFKKADGKFDYIDKFCIIGSQGPKHQFNDWCSDPPQDDGDGWDDSDIFSNTEEEAFVRKLQYIDRIAELETLCKYCPSRSACRGILVSLAQVTKALALKTTRTELMNMPLEKTRSPF